MGTGFPVRRRDKHKTKATMMHDFPNGHSHGHTHGHSHSRSDDHGHPHPHSEHNSTPSEHLHSHMHGDNAHERAEEVKTLTASFLEGFRAASDKPSYLRLAGIPFQKTGEDGLTMNLVDASIHANWQIGTASPGFASREPPGSRPPRAPRTHSPLPRRPPPRSCSLSQRKPRSPSRRSFS